MTTCSLSMPGMEEGRKGQKQRRRREAEGGRKNINNRHNTADKKLNHYYAALMSLSFTSLFLKPLISHLNLNNLDTDSHNTVTNTQAVLNSN